MSAKLLKSLAMGQCHVRNVSNGEVIVYWKNDRLRTDHLTVSPQQEIDLTKYASIAQLRKSPNLKNLFSRGHLRIVPA